MVKPLVSIIIPTLNSEVTIWKCLQSIKNQAYPSIETLIIDDYSSDGTAKIAKNFDAKVLLKRCGRSEARNFGATEADGLFVLFVDSDQELTREVVGECVETCLVDCAEAAIIPEESLTRGFVSECRKMERGMHVGDRLFEAPRFFKKDIFFKLGGYDAKLTFGEDSDLRVRMEKADFKTCRISSEILHYEKGLSIRGITLKAYYYGRSLPYLIRKNPSLTVEKHFPTLRRCLSSLKILYIDPIHALGLVFMKAVEYEAYVTGALTCFLENKR
jgi:glycosyltransferase involved in cell wall biosynthesis